MNVKKILAISVLVLTIFCCMNVASAGIFDFLGGGTEVVNQTYTFDGFTLDLPQNATIINFTNSEDGYNVNSFIATWGSEEEDNEGSIFVNVMSGEYLVDSVNEYVANWVADGAKAEGTYGDWSIININGVTISNENDTFTGYILAKHDGERLYGIRGDDLSQVEKIADTFKKV